MPHPPPHSFFRNDRRALAATLVDLADRTTVDGPWRSGAFAAVADSGVLAGFMPQECGGTGLTEAETTALLVSIAERCLTTALVLTQWAAAVRIIASSPDPGKHDLLPPLARGESPTTVGISHLTTSRRHLGRPALVATRSGDGWSLDGECPWVTGADAASSIVTGAGDGRRRPGVLRRSDDVSRAHDRPSPEVARPRGQPDVTGHLPRRAAGARARQPTGRRPTDRRPLDDGPRRRGRAGQRRGDRQ